MPCPKRLPTLLKVQHLLAAKLLVASVHMGQQGHYSKHTSTDPAKSAERMHVQCGGQVTSWLPLHRSFSCIVSCGACVC